MKKNILLLLWFMSIVAFAEAQNLQKGAISGIVHDSVGKSPVAMVTVGLYKTDNLKLPVKNLLTNSKGIYEFKDVDSGSYVIFYTHASFQEKQQAVSVNTENSSIKMEAVYLIEIVKELSGVRVAAQRKKPLVEQEEDKTIYNAEADPSNAGLTALDLFRKTPFLSVDGEDNITLNGQANFRILLNGKETSMFTNNPKTVLKGFPANLVKKIEVITNPSAKYDGEGVGGLINIITAKKVLGYNGWAGINFNSFNYNIYTGLNAKYGKFGISGYFANNKSDNPEGKSYGEIISVNPVAYSKRISNGTQRNNYNGRSGNLELSYDIDSLNTASVYGSINGGNNESWRNSFFDLVLPTLTDTIKSSFVGYTKSDFPNYNWGADFIRKFKRKKDQELTLKFFNEYNKGNSYDTSGQFYPGADKYILNDNISNNRQVTLQSDFVLPLKKNRKLEIGVKSIFRKAISDYKNYFRTEADTKYELITSNSNFFDYRQTVYGVYSTYRFSWKKVSFRIGARWEKTIVNGDFKSSNTNVKQDYGTFLPNIFLSKKFKNIHTVSLSYSKRLNRPFIWNLNPFVNNTDTLNISYGNPNLGPQLTHNIELGYSVFKGRTSINIKLSEIFSNTEILRYSTFNDATGIRETSSYNIGVTATTSLTTNINAQLNSKWSLFLNMGIKYVFLKNKELPSQKNQGFGGNGFLNSNYQISKKLSAFISGNLWQNPVTLQGRTLGSFSYTTGISQKLFKDKLSVSINGSNFLRKYRKWYSKMQDINFSYYSENNNVARAFGIGLNWSFGKLSENVSRKRGVTNDDLKAKD